MTDNPTPNDIALLREAAQALVDRFPQEWPDYSPCYDEVAALRAALAPGQHDGAAGEGQPVPKGHELPTIPAGMKPWAGGDSAPADWDGEEAWQRGGGLVHPDEIERPWNNDGLLGDIIAYTPKPSTERARAEGYVLVPRVPTEAMIIAGMGKPDRRGQFPCNVHPSDVWTAMLDAASTPSGADALGGRL